jgi:hypothetical protein
VAREFFFFPGARARALLFDVFCKRCLSVMTMPTIRRRLEATRSSLRATIGARLEMASLKGASEA